MWPIVSARHSKVTSAMSILVFIALATTAFASEALKNHAPEKRQGDGYVLFGGWKPIKPGSPFYHGSQTGKYHDLLSAIPETLDTSSTYYSSSLPNYAKDIYNYYPRPAIKSAFKAKAPVYMENFKRNRKPQKQDKGSPGGIQTLNIAGLKTFDLQQLKQLHDVLLSAHHLPLSNIQQGKNVQYVEVALQPLQEVSAANPYSDSQLKPKSRYFSNTGYGRGSPVATSPIKLEYLPPPHLEVKPSLNYGVSKSMSVVPIHIPPKAVSVVPVHVPSVEDIIDIKNVQIVEVPVPQPLHLSPRDKGGLSSIYGNRGAGRGDKDFLRRPAPKHKQQLRHMGAYMPPQLAFAKSYAAPIIQEQPKSVYTKQAQPQPQQRKPQHQPQQQHQEIPAELITVNDDQLKTLLKSIQIIDKNSNDILRYLPLSEAKNAKDDLHLLVAIPHTDSQQGNQESYGGEHPSEKEEYQRIIFPGSNDPQGNNYEIKKHAEGNPNGYQVVPQVQNNHENYEPEGRNQYEGNNDQQPGQQEVEYHHEKDVSYGEPDDKQASYEDQRGDPQQHLAYDGHQQVSYEGGDQQRNYGQQPQQPQLVDYKTDSEGRAYIQVNAHMDENGYRREPVLAVELKHGQTVEDAIKALDPETLQRLGAHTKDGVEIEVVEIPVDDYPSESKKQETVVSSSNNSTTPTPTKKTKTGS